PDQHYIPMRLRDWFAPVNGNRVRSVHLPVNPPMLPMLAKRIDELPAGQTWIFEPKWDERQENQF
ncbi:MAG: hypothetical protein WA197_22470, partial [Candidatus Acidiferrales bacterium]